MGVYRDFFKAVTGQTPYPYQIRLAEEDWPDVLDVPTGLGKTAAILVAWLWKLHRGDAGTPRRLAYCLPMRVLVEQTVSEATKWVDAARPVLEESGRKVPAVHLLMGGRVSDDWRRHPERPTILVGTQDMLLSRALMRGYGMSRYGWPVDFALLHNDCIWVFDEVQLMGPAVATSAQLDAFRGTLSTAKGSRSLWASATLEPAWLTTVDFPRTVDEIRTLRIGDEDRKRAGERVGARKRLHRSGVTLEKLTASELESYAAELASAIVERHRPGTQTLVVVNRVDRAQALFAALAQADATADVLLLHSRFRPSDRRSIETRLRDREMGAEGRIVVSTQAIEAGVDISSATLITELAPWSSLVQRFGRCNRYGEVDGGSDVLWVDLKLTGTDAAPYEVDDLDRAREVLEQGLEDVGPSSLPEIPLDPPTGQVLRQRDLLELFNTDPDLQGFEVDISPFIRDQGHPQVQVFWREVDEEAKEAEPHRDELCSVSMGQIEAYRKKRVRGDRKRIWRWEPLPTRSRDGGRWIRVNLAERIVPGSILMLHSGDGGYDARLGFEPSLRAQVPLVLGTEDSFEPDSFPGDNAEGRSEQWVTLEQHTKDVRADLQDLGHRLNLDDDERGVLDVAALWHDLGKAHPAFQTAILDTEALPSSDVLWAKSPGRGVPRYRIESEDGELEMRRFFRHELASMLAWILHNSDHPDVDLVGYLIAAHHGKVRLGLRAMPGETGPGGDRLYARGVWEGDELPAVAIDGWAVPETRLSLDLMRMGEGDMGPSWIERTARLVEGLGPFRLSWLEAVLRIADWRASARAGESR